MDVKTDDDGGHITFSCNVAGYRPEELKVDIEGDSLVVKGFLITFNYTFHLHIWCFRWAQGEARRANNPSYIPAFGHSSGWDCKGLSPMQCWWKGDFWFFISFEVNKLIKYNNKHLRWNKCCRTSNKDLFGEWERRKISLKIEIEDWQRNSQKIVGCSCVSPVSNESLISIGTKH